MLTDQQRKNIVRIAREWAGTPYKGCSRMKGCGCDCLTFVSGVYQEAGLLPQDLPIPVVYSMNAGQHVETTEYIDGISTYFREIPESEVKVGDIVMYKLDKAFAHSALVEEWPKFVWHALVRHGVHGSHGTEEAILRNKPRRFFTVREGD